MGEVKSEKIHRIQTGTREFDRVLGGGLAAGSVVLLGGEPGKGKSTLAQQVGSELADGLDTEGFEPLKVLYASGEETPAQIKDRNLRIMGKGGKMILMNEVRIDSIEKAVSEIDPDLLIIDSIQRMRMPDNGGGTTDTIQQQKECSEYLTALTKHRDMTTLLISQVVKGGEIAGPKAMEHVVDVVLNFDAARNSNIRILSASKNRFGDTTEVGIFQMTNEGLKSVDDPEAHLIRGRKGMPGSVVACVMLNASKRAILVEVQALVTPSYENKPKRSTTGYAASRLNMIMTILDAHTQWGRAACGDGGGEGGEGGEENETPLNACDIFVNIAPDGFNLEDASLDLPIALAIVSAFLGVPLPAGSVAWGEMGLTGEVRPANDHARIMAMVKATQFRKTICSSDDGIITIEEALDHIPSQVKGNA